MNAVIYARFSSHNQNEHSIEGQVKECMEFAKRNNYNVIEVYKDEGQSGKNDKRISFQQMISDSKSKTFERVIVYQFDRFARNRNDSAKNKTILLKNGVKVVSATESITDDPIGIVIESMFEGLAEYFSADLGKKVSRGLKTNAEKCFNNGGNTPLGLKLKSKYLPIGVDGKMVKKQIIEIDDNSAYIVKTIFEMYAQGNSMAHIIKYLNEMNYKTSKGNNFNKNSLARILTNRKYIGVYTYDGIEVEGGIPQLIDKNTFDKCQEIMKKNKMAPARAKAPVEYILTTKLFCGDCGQPMTGISGKRKESYEILLL